MYRDRKNIVLSFITFLYRDTDENEEEWAIIELQGDLECRDGTPLQSQFIGDLHFRKQDVRKIILSNVV